jgi:hypothetical protein
MFTLKEGLTACHAMGLPFTWKEGAQQGSRGGREGLRERGNF